MEKITSFTIDHTRLLPGLYVSRIDECNGVRVTTFDLRIKTPNIDPVIDTGALHAFEHLGATFLRNCDIKDKIVYFGPMGCRTGFYLVVFGEALPREICPFILEMLDFIISYEGEIPGASPVECGNYKDLDLDGAKLEAKSYKEILLTTPRFSYPE